MNNNCINSSCPFMAAGSIKASAENDTNHNNFTDSGFRSLPNYPALRSFMPNPMLPTAGSPDALEVDWAMLPRHDRVLLAVSGGADSMALLLALARSDRDFVVGHINHGLRGDESE